VVASHKLPNVARELADNNHKLLAADPRRRSLRLKNVGTTKQPWSVRVGMHDRALRPDEPEGMVWFWIGSHAEYDKLLSDQ
jgi:hypothetical protein